MVEVDDYHYGGEVKKHVPPHVVDDQTRRYAEGFGAFHQAILHVIKLVGNYQSVIEEACEVCRTEEDQDAEKVPAFALEHLRHLTPPFSALRHRVQQVRYADEQSDGQGEKPKGHLLCDRLDIPRSISACNSVVREDGIIDLNKGNQGPNACDQAENEDGQLDENYCLVSLFLTGDHCIDLIARFSLRLLVVLVQRCNCFSTLFNANRYLKHDCNLDDSNANFHDSWIENHETIQKLANLHADHRVHNAHENAHD